MVSSVFVWSEEKKIRVFIWFSGQNILYDYFPNVCEVLIRLLSQSPTQVVLIFF